MEGISWPIALYDVVGILVPGLIVPALLGLSRPDIFQFYGCSLLIVLVAAFVIGHVVQSASGLLYRLLGRLRRPRRFLEMAPPEFREQIESSVRRFYGFKLSEVLVKSRLRDLCYSPVWNRLENYRLFTTLGDVNRAFGFLSLMASVEFAGLGAGLWPGAVGRCEAWLLALGALALFFLFSDRMLHFRRLAELVIYHSFLSFVADADFARRSEEEEGSQRPRP